MGVEWDILIERDQASHTDDHTPFTPVYRPPNQRSYPLHPPVLTHLVLLCNGFGEAVGDQLHHLYKMVVYVWCMCGADKSGGLDRQTDRHVDRQSVRKTDRQEQVKAYQSIHVHVHTYTHSPGSHQITRRSK